MTPHVSDDLPRLLTGEAERQLVLDAAAHLRNCVDCQQELVSAVVAHASLTSAQRFAPEVVGREVRAASAEEAPASVPAPRPLPDLSELFAEVHQERPGAESGARVSRTRRLALVGAAAAVVLGGAGAAAYVATTGGSTGNPAETVALQPYDTGRVPATATMSSTGSVLIRATQLPKLTGKRYEVWVTDAARQRMQPIGWISSDGVARLQVPQALLHRFSDIEVSVQPLDAKSYSYSGVSVLRGSYA